LNEVSELAASLLSKGGLLLKLVSEFLDDIILVFLDLAFGLVAVLVLLEVLLQLLVLGVDILVVL